MTFSNGGVDTFDPAKSFIGIRLQQGVPLLDRDWNELEDIRRFLERSLRANYVGEGVPDGSGFAVSSPSYPAPADVVIGAGRCSVAGFDLWNQSDEVLFSAQGDGVPLPPALPDAADVLTLYLEPDVVRVSSADDPALGNPQDINLETCVRDRLVWSVRAVRQPGVPAAGTYVIAEVARPAGATQITSDMITDRRRTLLNLAAAVDRLGRTEASIAALTQALTQAQLDIESMKQDLGRLFWDVTLEGTSSWMFFGGRATVLARVHDRLGNPVAGAMLSFTTDWGVLSPPFASTDANGQATVELVGVPADVPLRLDDVGLLQRASDKVSAAVLPNADSVEYAKVRFEPEELAVVSRYSSPTHLADLGTDLPVGPVVARPDPRTSTVTVYAREGAGPGVVRGVSSLQVTYGLWVRDFVRTKIGDVARTVEVGARIGDVMRQGFTAGQFDHAHVANDLLPPILQAIDDDTHAALKQAVFADPQIDDDHVAGTGVLSQIIAQEATAAVGARTNQAIARQLSQFAAAPQTTIDAAGAQAAQTVIVQRASQITAGFSQQQRQRYSGALLGH
jgi:hypothetical protein